MSNNTINAIISGNQTSECGLPVNDAWTMLREPSDPEMPWPGFIFGQTAASLWYWCADQVSGYQWKVGDHRNSWGCPS